MNVFPYPSYPPPKLASPGAPKRVVVIGAGLAGLVAAYELVAAGHDVTVLEASDRAGGRVETLRAGFTDGLYAEAGAYFVPGAHSYTVGYALEFGLALVERGKQGRSTTFLGGWRIDDGHIGTWPVAVNDSERTTTAAQWMSKYVGAGVSQVLAVDPRSPDWPPASLAPLDAQTFADFLMSVGASAGAVSVLRRGFFDLWGDGVDACSALLILRDYSSNIVAPATPARARQGQGHAASQTFRARPAPDAPPGPPTPAPVVTSPAEVDPQGLYHIQNGNDTLPRAFADRLGGHIRFGAVVNGIEQDDRGVRVYCDGDESPVTADHAIVTVPFSVLRSIEVTPAFSADKSRAIAELPYTSVTRVFLEFDERFWFTDNLEGLSSTDLPRRHHGDAAGFWIEETTAVQPGVAGILDCYMAGPQARWMATLPDDELVEITLDQVERVFPGAKSHYTGNFMKKIWDDDPYACGAYGWFRPGQMTTLYPVLATAEGRIHFAGEATSVLPAWMQGALESGVRAASEVNDA